MDYIFSRTKNIKNFLLFLFVIVLFLIFPAAVFSELDSDNDGLSDKDEIKYGTDMNNFDTDGDEYNDGEEILAGYSPLCGQNKKAHECDFDNDGLNDWLEIWFHSDIKNQDTDGDSFFDGDEVKFGFDPTSREPIKKFKRMIEVDRTKQRVYYYVDGVKFYNFPASTGNYYSETPGGEFKIEKKIENKRYTGPGYDLPGVKWNMQFKPMFYIHAAYWHNDFGIKTHSHGCVNLREADAAELYKYTEEGVDVKVTGKTPKKFYVGT